MEEPLAETMLTQCSVKKGLKVSVFGEAGADAVVKELQQLHDPRSHDAEDEG